jgi:hypothetical protein
MGDESPWSTLFWVVAVVLTAWFVLSVQIPAIETDARVRAQLKADAVAAEQAKQAAQHPSWPWSVINQHQIQLGMTGDMVKASWGEPDDINRSVGSWGVHEQWVYGCYYEWCNPPQYLYFENGILTSWQD